MKRNIFSTLKFLLGLKTVSHRSISESEARVVDILRNRLNTYMLQQKPFLKEHYTLKDLSDEMGIPLHQLSAFLNKQVGMNFNDYLNQFRIRYCEELIKNELPGKVNLKELIYRSGFHNRNTFSAAFKKFTGKTPSDYVRDFDIGDKQH
jgi:YesN/AraC family two-component response regulator